MTIRHTLITLILGIFVGFYGICAPVKAQSEDPEQLLIQADQLIGDGNSAAAWPILENLSQTYPGQPWDAEARMHKAYVLLLIRNQVHEGQAMLESIVRDFASTEVGFRARGELLDVWLLSQGKFDSESPIFHEYLTRLDVLLDELGGSPLESLVYAIRPIGAMDSDLQRYHLESLYKTAAGRLRAAAASGQFSSDSPDKNALKRAFLWDLRRYALFPKSFGDQEPWSLHLKGFPIFGLASKVPLADTTGTQIIPEFPQPDSQVTESSPVIRFSLKDHSVHDQAVDIEEVQVLLDGQTLSEYKLEILANLESPTHDFLTYSFSFRPTSNLAPGTHRIKVKANELGLNENPTELEWTFTVTSHSKAVSRGFTLQEVASGSEMPNI